MIEGARLRRFILARRSHPERLAIAVGLVAVGFGVRWIVDRGAGGLPFTTFYPAVLVAAVLLDWRYAAFASALSVVAIRLLSPDVPLFPEYDLQRIVLLLLLAFAAAVLILVGTMLRRMLAEVDELMERQAGFNRELQHRIKNSLAIVQALAAQGARAADPPAFFRDFGGRLAALAKGNELLSVGSNSECILPDLAEEAVGPFNGEGRIILSGDPCEVPSVACVPLVMALHELCTNALKHGALSNAEGSVALGWRVEATEHGKRVCFEWRESGGPAVAPPTRRGLGSRLLVRQKGIEAVETRFEPEGLCCDIRTVPL
jgi:two-component sensor histidine kinase